MRNASNYEQATEHQFDSFCKKVLQNEARNTYARNKRKNEKLVSLESLTLEELSQLCTYDTYESEYIFLVTHDYKIPIEDILIAQAIESLSNKQQDIILLSFFLSMKEIDIATLMNLTQSTVHYHKDKALCELRKFMEDYKNGN
jgi:DNA-directed RNA polymerase specialized sigma subunit, sigma24 homolog